MEILEHIVIILLIVMTWFNERRFEAIADCLKVLHERLDRNEHKSDN